MMQILLVCLANRRFSTLTKILVVIYFKSYVCIKKTYLYILADIFAHCAALVWVLHHNDYAI